MANIKKKEVIIDFREFGLNNPTVIQFYPNENEFVRYEIKGASVEQICNKIKSIQRLFGCENVRYTTSPYNLRDIKQCSLANIMKSVWQLFVDSGITIYESKEDLS